MQNVFRQELKESLDDTIPIVDWLDHYDLVLNNHHAGKQKHSLSLLNFTFGNPHNIIPGYINILKKCADPPSNLTLQQKQTYYRYRFQSCFIKEREYIANKLNTDSSITNYKWNTDNIILTTGAYAGLYASISTFININDEVIYLLPHWFRYYAMIKANYGIPKPINIMKTISDKNNMNLIKNYIIPSITKKTKVFIFNTPHNPTGITFDQDELILLSNMLEQKSKKYGHSIWIISDESYRDFVYDNKKYHSITEYYPYSIIVYTYGKITLAPGQRVGWIAISPLLKSVNSLLYTDVHKYLVHMIRLCGYLIPNVIPGKAIIEIEDLIDKLKNEQGLIKEYEIKRDLIYNTITTKLYKGYIVGNKPCGSFYFLFKPPTEYNMDGREFCKEFIKSQNVMILPGYTFGLKEWIRITYTAPIWKVSQFCERLVAFDAFLQRTRLKRSKL